MASEWPSTLADKLLEAGFGLGFGSTTISTEMDTGLPKKRRRFTKGIDVFNCTIDMDRDLYNTFYDFYNTTLNGGVGYFLFDHPITGVESVFEFVDDPGIRSKGGRVFTVTMVWRLIP